MRRILVLLVVGIPSIILASGMGVASAQPANPLDGWKYPESIQIAAGSGGGNFLVLATPDALDKVVAFYNQKVGKKLTSDIPGATLLRGGNGEVWMDQDDSVQPGPNAERRPVVVRIFVERAKDHYLTLVITHAKGEDQTHISLTYIPK
ncbi:MAG: hypothetical protein JO112_17885 [Planctomycetes bacterium]|nr:hypothetical protein [Planctomycetota bacterium]